MNKVQAFLAVSNLCEHAQLLVKSEDFDVIEPLLNCIIVYAQQIDDMSLTYWTSEAIKKAKAEQWQGCKTQIERLHKTSTAMIEHFLVFGTW